VASARSPAGRRSEEHGKEGLVHADLGADGVVYRLGMGEAEARNERQRRSGVSVGIIGTGGVGVATASALIMRGLTGRVTLYNRNPDAAHGLALDFMNGRALLSRVEVRGRGLDEIEPEDILVITAGAHTTPGQSRLDVLHRNLEVMDGLASAVEAGGLPRIALMVTNPVDVLTEYLNRRWRDEPVSVMGTGTALETLRLTDTIARECGVHVRSVHAWVVGEHGDSCVFLLGSAVVGTIPLAAFAAQRDLDLSPERLQLIADEVRTAAYQIRDLQGSAVQGIGLTVSGLVHALTQEEGALIPVSVRVGDGICASLPCVIGSEGPSAPMWPPMNDDEQAGWRRSLEVLGEANALLPITP
jgi:L-lactate dehydrogenase